MKKKIKSRNIYDNAITYDNVYKIWKIVKCTCKNREEVFNFSLNLNANLMNIYYALKNKTYIPSRYRTFMIFEPKPRLVMSQSVFDKIVNHFVANYYLLPYLEKGLVDANVATRKEKGSKSAMSLIKKYVNEIVINERPNEIYCLKIDISKYFYTIDHNILISKLEKELLDKDVIDIIKRILKETNEDYINENISSYNSYYGTDIPFYIHDRGLSIGAMTSQFLAIYYLSELDHLIIEKLNCKYLVHYMDDIIIFDTNKEKLKDVWKILVDEIKKLNLNINKKSNLYRLTSGIDFLGFHYKYRDYKLYISYKKKTFYRIRSKLAWLEKNDLFKLKKTKASYYGYFTVVNEKYVREDFKMRSLELYDAYKEKYKNTLVIVKEGIFYSAYREDANIIWHMFGYKHLFDKVSFGSMPYDKVVSELKANDISFCVVDKEREYYKYKGDDEIYINYLYIANKAYEKQQKEEILIAKVKEVYRNDSTKYDEVLAFLDNLIDVKEV